MSRLKRTGYSKSDDCSDKELKHFDGNNQILPAIDDNSDVIKYFKLYAAKLDDYHDRFERIVKISRDIVMESKRIIFLLHTCDGVNKREKALMEAESRLNALVKSSFFKIALELKEEDPYNFHKSFTFALQEFIEAFTFYHYLKDKKLYHWDYYQNMLKYSDSQVTHHDKHLYNVTEEAQINNLLATLPPTDYLLGVADLSGELMRRCNNNVGLGNLEECFDTCNMVKNLYAGFLSLSYTKGIKLYSKMFTLKRSLLKMEKVCYNLYVRNKEPGGGRLMPLFNEIEYADRDEEF